MTLTQTSGAVGAILSSLLSAAAVAAPNDLHDTNHDFFTLRCEAAETAPLSLYIDVSAEGDFSVAYSEAAPRQPVATYTNAVSWERGAERFTLDRFTGELVAKPSGARYHCRREGGRLF